MDYQAGGLSSAFQGEYAKAEYGANQTRPAGDVSRIIENLGQIIAHVEQMGASVARVANELFGPPPPSPGAPIESGRLDKHVGGIDAVHGHVDVLRVQLAGLYQAMERFQRLV